ncbi:hypothetical protein NFI96_018638, partial [Prochilodus magdalenae]
FQNSSVSLPDSSFLDAVGEVIINNFTATQLTNATIISEWFQRRIRPFLSSVSADFLSNLGSKNFSCEAYQVVIEALSSREQVLTANQTLSVVNSFIVPFLTGDRCVQSLNDSEWLVKNFGQFRRSLSFSKFTQLKSNFDGVKAAEVLTSSQLAELCSDPSRLKGPQDVNTVMAAVGPTELASFFDIVSPKIRPLLLRDKLMKMEVDMHLVTWITDYLTGRPQHVRIRDCSSDTVISSTGAPQGTVLSPVLFTLYTSDFKYNSELCHMQKFSDDTAIVGCVRNGQEREYRSLVEDFVEWCTTNHLKLNITKTKEMCIDFRRSRPSQQPISIKGVDVEVVRSYRYLGVHLDERLDWSVNTDIVYKKAQSRLYFLRRLGSFRICQKLLLLFYQSVVASVLFYAVVCWGGSISKRDAGRLDRLVRKAGSVLGLELESLTPLAERRALNKLLNIMDNVHHPLHTTIIRQRSSFSGRLLSQSCSTDRLRKSFVPQAIRLFNSSHPDLFLCVVKSQGNSSAYSPEVKGAFLHGVLARGEQFSAALPDSEVRTWVNERLQPLLSSMSVADVAPFFNIIRGRNCSLIGTTYEFQFYNGADLNAGLESLGFLGSLFNSSIRAEIQKNIQQLLAGPKGLDCYQGGNFYNFIVGNFYGYELPDLGGFLSIIPASRRQELLGTIPPETLSNFLNMTNTVKNLADLCTLFNNYNRTAEYLKKELIVSEAVGRQTLECVWPSVLNASSQNEVDQWFDVTLLRYLPYLSSKVINPTQLSGASCLSYRKLVSILGNYTYSGTDFTRAEVYSSIKAYLKSSNGSPRCYSASDPLLNSTAWFSKNIGAFTPFVSLADLQSFVSDSQIGVFLENPESIQLFNDSRIASNVTRYYGAQLYAYKPNFSPLRLLGVLLCGVPGSAYTSLSAADSQIILDSLKTSCQSVSREVTAALVANFPTITTDTIQTLGNQSIGLTEGQISAAPPEAINKTVTTLGAITGWNQGQVNNIIQSITNAGFKIDSGSKLVELGTLIGGVPSENISKIPSAELLTVVNNTTFINNILTAPAILQQTLVNKIVSIDESKVVQNVPDELAGYIPPVVLSTPIPVNVTLINKKSWKQDQAQVLFRSVASASDNTEELSESILQGFTCSSVQKLPRLKITQLVRACRPRSGRKKVFLKESQLTCMYNYVKDDASLNFSDFPADMLLYYRPRDSGPFHTPNFVGEFGDGPFLFQHGRTPVHRASSIKTWRSESGVEELDWPAQSPDLHPIEHLWDGLERRLGARPSRPTSVSDLTNVILEECTGKLTKENCRSFFSAQGGADFSVLSSVLNRQSLLFTSAKDCLGVSGVSLTKDQVDVLGNMACTLDPSYIQNSDPQILEKLKNCGDLSDSQVAAVQTQLFSGNTVYGKTSTWTLDTLNKLGMLPLYLSQSFWDTFSSTTKKTFLKTFIPLVKKQNTDIRKLRRLFTASNSNTRTLTRAATECTAGQITEAVIAESDFPVGYDSTQFDACLNNALLKDNLAAVTEKVVDPSLLKVLLGKTQQLHPAGFPESVVKILNAVSREASVADINTWNITTIDALSALMNPKNGDWTSEKSKAVIMRYLSKSGNVLGTPEINAIQSYLCTLDVDTLRGITAPSLQPPESSGVLHESSCWCSTIGRRLHHAGLPAHRPLPRLSLTPRHRHQTLQWCRTRLSWSDSEWQRVIFSGESRFSLGGDAQRTRVWRHRGQHRDEQFGVTRPEGLVSLHLHPYRTICRNCVRMFKLHGMDYHRTPSGTSTAPYRDVWKANSVNVSSCSAEQKSAMYSVAKSAFSSQRSDATTYYHLISPYLGGAPLVDIIDLSNMSISMDITTFLSLNPDVIKGLNVTTVRNLMGENVVDLKLFENSDLVKMWAAQQYNSELATLGLSGGKEDPVSTTTQTTGTTIINTTSQGVVQRGSGPWLISLCVGLLTITLKTQ